MFSLENSGIVDLKMEKWIHLKKLKRESQIGNRATQDWKQLTVF